MLPLHAVFGLLPQNFFEQDSLVRHVLVDDPEAVASGGDDEAVVNLAQRPQVGKDRQALRSFGAVGQRAVRIRNRLRGDALEIEARLRARQWFSDEIPEDPRALRGTSGIGYRLELLIFDALREVGIGKRRRPAEAAAEREGWRQDARRSDAREWYRAQNRARMLPCRNRTSVLEG